MSATEHAIPSKVDIHLQEVALAQFTFKPGKLRAVGVAIARAFNEAPGTALWADEIPLPELDADSRNCIGTAWKNLARWGIIERLEGASDHRRSKREGRRGGVCWRYRLASEKLLHAFMRANQIEIKPKQYTQANLI